MNSFAQSKTEVFEKIAESLRPLCMAEDLNDDEILLNPSTFASCTTWLEIREGFAVDLTTARDKRNNAGPQP